MRRRRVSDVDYLLVRFTAIVHMFVGAVLIISSGIILFALPAWAFWLTFWVGMYFFIPGSIITFKIATKEKTHTWARFMVPLWKLLR